MKEIDNILIVIQVRMFEESNHRENNIKDNDKIKYSK